MTRTTATRISAAALSFVALGAVGIATAGSASAAGASPICQNDFYTINQGESLTVDAAGGLLGNDSDPESDVLSIGTFFNTDGTLVLNTSDGSFAFAPDASFSGDYTFFYRASDDFSMCDETTATITVLPTVVSPPVPVGVADAYSTQEGVTLTVGAPGVMANDPGATFVVNVQNVPEGLTPEFDGSFVYVPPVGFTGDVTWQYRMTQGDDIFSDWINATITVTPAPVIAEDDADLATLANTGEATGWLVSPALALLVAGFGAVLYSTRRRSIFTK